MLNRPGDKMADRSLAVRSAPARLREARRQLHEAGEIADGQIDSALRNSWQRSRQFGLAPTGRAPGAPHASAAQLARALERQRELLSHARPVMEFLFEQTRDADSIVILADAQGMLLQALGEGGLRGSRAARGVAPGRQLARTLARHQCDRHRAHRQRAAGRARPRTLPGAQRLPHLHGGPDHRPGGPGAGRARHFRRPSRLPPPHAARWCARRRASSSTSCSIPATPPA